MAGAAQEGREDAEDLVVVRLVSLPVAIHQRAVQHIDEIRREFFYIAAEPGGVPARMLALGLRIGTQFAPFAASPRAALAAAAAAGDEVIDLDYRIPAGAGAAARAADDMLDEVDGFCAAGGMLTLGPTPEVLAYRHWFFGEFERQADGHPPTPWPEWAAVHLAA